MRQSVNYNKFNRFEVTQNEEEEKETQSLISQESGLESLMRNCLVFCPILFALIVIVIFSVMIGMMNSQDYTYKSSAVRIMNKVNDALKANSISQIQTVSLNSQCPSGYEQINAGQFTGIKSGCICNDGSLATAARCSVDSSCSSVTAVGSSNYQIYDGFKICGQIVNNWKMIPSGGACPSGYINCNAYRTCVVLGQFCPVVTVVYSGPIVTPQGTSQPTFSTLQSAVDPKSPNGTNYGSLIALDLVDNYINQRCLDPATQPLRNSQLNYPLFVTPRTGCGFFGVDTKTVFITSKDMKNFYTENNLINTFNNLPFYNDKFTKKDVQDYVALYATYRPVIKDLPICDQVTNGVLGTFSTTSNYILKIVKGFGIACIILSCIALILGVLIVIKRHDNESAFSLPPSLIFLCVLTFVIAILIIIMGSILIDSYNSNNMGQNIQAFNDIVNNNCLETLYMKPAQYLQNFMNVVWSYQYPLGVTLFIISFIFILVIFTAFIVRFINKELMPCSPI